MDENAFRETYRALNQLDCPFEKAIVICRHGCRNSRASALGNDW